MARTVNPLLNHELDRYGSIRGSGCAPWGDPDAPVRQVSNRRIRSTCSYFFVRIMITPFAARAPYSSAAAAPLMTSIDSI